MIAMSYTYEIDVQAMFDDRTDQFEKFGIPLGDIEKVRAAVTDMWADAPGGWGYEWSKLAGAYAERVVIGWPLCCTGAPSSRA